MDWIKTKRSLNSSKDHLHASLGVISADLSTTLSKTNWFKCLNDYSSELSKSMDKEFLKDGISKIMTPNNHHIVDAGHDFFSTIEMARNLGEKNNWSDIETFEQWAKAYFTDLSSKDARDFVSLNGQEALEAVLGAALGGRVYR